jgi:hypothetical protein
MLKSNLTLLLTKFLNHQNKLATVASQVNMFFGGRRICKRLRNQKSPNLTEENTNIKTMHLQYTAQNKTDYEFLVICF